METAGQNEAEIPPKRIKFEEMMEEGEEVDRISELPDCLLLKILSRLPCTQDAIKTGTLSKRWEQVWTSVPVLIFSELYNDMPWSDLVPIIDKTLTQCRPLKLEKFLLCSSYEDQSESQVNNWIRYAIRRDVEELNISCEDEHEFVLDQFIFTSSCFTDVRLQCCVINPTGPISWNKLRSLSISYATFDEDVVENTILSGSPLLETLELVRCYGYRRLDITSKSVKNLVFCRYDDPRESSGFYIIEINAPNILSLKIKEYMGLQNILLVNVSSLVEANLDYTWGWDVDTSFKKAEEKMLKRFIQNLSHVKELKIGVFCSKVLARLEARGFVFPSNLRIPDGFKRVEYGDWSVSAREHGDSSDSDGE